MKFILVALLTAFVTACAAQPSLSPQEEEELRERRAEIRMNRF